MNIKKSLLIAAIASVATTSAFASTTPANPTATGYSFVDNTLSGLFNETYTFTALSSGTYSFLNYGSDTIGNFTGNLFDVTAITSVGNFQTTFTGNAFWDTYTVTGAFNLTQGHQYAFSFSGDATGTHSPNYQGSVAAPVPEPETFAMLLAGLGLIGAVTRRRNKLSIA